jgi:hypothetical protein
VALVMMIVVAAIYAARAWQQSRAPHEPEALVSATQEAG